MNEPFLEGHTIYLRLPTDEDVLSGRWHTWYNDYETTRFNSHGVFPVSKEQELAFLQEAQESPTTILLAIVAKDEDTLIGNISLQNIDLLNRKAEIALTVGEAEYRGRSCGLQAVGLMTDHAFSRLNLNRVYSQAHQEFARFWSKLGIFGYQMEGTLRQDYLRDNEYSNMVRFAVLAEDFWRIKNARNGNALLDNLDQLLEEVSKHSQ